MENKLYTIVEMQPTGHRVTLYLREQINAVNSSGHTLRLLISEKVLQSEQFNEILTEYPMIEFDIVNDQTVGKNPNAISLFLTQRRRLSNIVRFLENEKRSHVILNTFDDFFYALLLVRIKSKINISGIYVSPKLSFGNYNIYKISKTLVRLILVSMIINMNKNIQKLIFVDDFSYFNVMKLTLPSISATKLNLVSDVGDVQKPSDIHHDQHAKKKFTILVYGSLSKRKGINQLLNALKLVNANIRVIFAGTPDKSIENLICAEKLGKNIEVKKIFRYCDAKLESELFYKCDLVWLGYAKNFTSSSGVLYQAWSAQKPVIASQHGIIAYRVKKYKAGVTLNVDSSAKLAVLIDELSAFPPKYYDLVKNCVRLKHKFSKRNFELNLRRIFYE